MKSIPLAQDFSKAMLEDHNSPFSMTNPMAKVTLIRLKLWGGGPKNLMLATKNL